MVEYVALSNIIKEIKPIDILGRESA